MCKYSISTETVSSKGMVITTTTTKEVELGELLKEIKKFTDNYDNVEYLSTLTMQGKKNGRTYVFTCDVV